MFNEAGYLADPFFDRDAASTRPCTRPNFTVEYFGTVPSPLQQDLGYFVSQVKKLYRALMENTLIDVRPTDRLSHLIDVFTDELRNAHAA